ncbi:MAG TPA: bifunctional adenosylcobinamide kinase/adenosylcobinamide-phosphate guanylyltransferase [Spirochaetia bacterium]|nr:bifunctional adenosylcobinamide kinase/adenosylcobinamide-phosphate guanylyltransferase [Spirochaetia bacterium]
MGEMVFILGGARSGKSSFAMKLAGERSDASFLPLTYIATAQAYDEEMRVRIAKHREDRPATVRTIEEPLYVGSALMALGESVCLIDCLTLLMSNIMYATPDFDSSIPEKRATAEDAVQDEVDRIITGCREHTGDVIIVSNDVGVGVVPPYPDARLFQDIAGRAHQAIAAASSSVYYMVSGIPVKIK